MVGPEFGLMFEGSQGAWDWYAGGSFTAGFNWQNNIYKGANLPQNLGADYLRTNFAGGGVTTVNFSSASSREMIQLRWFPFQRVHNNRSSVSYRSISCDKFSRTSIYVLSNW